LEKLGQTPERFGLERFRLAQATQTCKFINNSNMIAIFLKPLILYALSARKTKGFRKMAQAL